MFSISNLWPVVIVVLIVLMKWLDRKICQYYAHRILESMPWMQWLTFDEILIRSRSPRMRTRKILVTYIYLHLLESDLNEQVNSADPVLKERFNQLAGSIDPFCIAEMMKYRRTKQLRRKNVRDLKQVEPPIQGLPVPA